MKKLNLLIITQTKRSFSANFSAKRTKRNILLVLMQQSSVGNAINETALVAKQINEKYVLIKEAAFTGVV